MVRVKEGRGREKEHAGPEGKERERNCMGEREMSNTVLRSIEQKLTGDTSSRLESLMESPKQSRVSE